MKLSELIKKVGDDVVQVQNLDECGITLDWSAKKGTRITFGSEMRLTPEGTERLGLIVWLPREAARAALRNEAKQP